MAVEVPARAEEKPQDDRPHLEAVKEPVKPAAPVENPKAKLRALPRVPLEGIVEIVSHGKARIIDISIGGILIESKDAIPIGTNLKFSIESKSLGKTVEMTGVIVRHADVAANKSKLGIEFTRVNPAYKRFLQDYVKSILSQSQD